MNQEDLQYLSLVVAQLHVSIGRLERALQEKDAEKVKLERTLGDKDAELSKLKQKQQGDVINIDKGKAGKGAPKPA